MAPLLIPSNYGYVFATLLAGVVYLFSLAFKVGRARTEANVPYPYVYAERAEAEKDPKKNIFNCTQRAHQHTLEMFPIFTCLLLMGGLSYPLVSSAAGWIWLAGRYVSATGYSSGDPAKRARGRAGHAGLLINLLTSIITICALIRK